VNIKTKVLLTVLAMSSLGGLSALGVFGAFSSTTSSASNQFASGTVTLGDNDLGASLYNVTNAKPGESISKCIKVTYTGSLEADVHLYTTSTIGTLGQYVELTITPGSQTSPSFPSCTGFTADSGGPLYSGTLSAFATAKNSYANGVVDYPGSTTKWQTNDSVIYQFTLTLQSSAPEAAQGLSTGSHTFTWEARNQ
jgi:Camelysin metallo-endopeptidase